MISISYTPNEWKKGDVLTADQLNATEKALKSIINKLEGKADNGTTDAGDENTIATVADIKQSISNLNVSTAEGNNLKTITSIGEIAGKINVTYSDIGKANGDTYGIVQAGTNLYADNGTLNVIDNPTFTEKLTAQKNVEFGTATVVDGVTSYTHEALIKANATIYGTVTINNSTTINGSTAINNNTTITGTVNIGTDNNGDYSIAKFNGTNNIIKGTTNILNNLTVGTATAENETITYAGTTIFNTQTNTFNGTTIFNDITFNGSLTFGSNAQVPWNKLINIPTATTIYTDNVITGSTGGIISAQDKSRLDQLYELTHNATNNAGKLLIMNETSGEAEWQSIYNSIPAVTSSAMGLMEDYQYNYLEGIIKIFKTNAGQLTIDQERSNPDTHHKYYPIYQLTLTSASDNNLTKNITAESIEEIENILPLGDLPTTDGTYNLQVEHIDNNIVYSWVPIT